MLVICVDIRGLKSLNLAHFWDQFLLFVPSLNFHDLSPDLETSSDKFGKRKSVHRPSGECCDQSEDVCSIQPKS